MSFLVFAFTACQSDNSEAKKEAEAEKQVSKTTDNVVAVKLAESRVKSFPLQVLATGKITALTQAKINFKTSGFIEKIMVSNSSIVNLWLILNLLL